MTSPHHRTRQLSARLLLASVAVGGLSGCANKTIQADADDPLVAAFVELLMPREIAIQHYLTKPISLTGDGAPDGLELILSASDAVGDPVKVVGTFHFELYTRRMASANRLGDRIAFWPVVIDSPEAFALYWDRLSRFYKFALALEAPLPAGRYIVTARLQTATGSKLYDEYEFDYEGGPAPNLRSSY